METKSDDNGGGGGDGGGSGGIIKSATQNQVEGSKRKKCIYNDMKPY